MGIELTAEQLKELQKGCRSTHGGAGFGAGTHIGSDGIVRCGLCGMKIGPAEKFSHLPEWVMANTYSFAKYYSK